MGDIRYNIYCDESCHLPNDKNEVMVLGALWCPLDRKKEIFDRIKEIKAKHHLHTKIEVKWNKVSKSKEAFYTELLDYFFDDDDLHFRALVVDKTRLNHQKFGDTHNSFYYKMYFTLLKTIFNPRNSYRVFLDIKDTQGQEKVNELLRYLRTTHYDYNHRIIKDINQVDSAHVQILQLADLLIGAMSYVHRKLNTNEAKLRLISRIQKRSGYSLDKSTLYKEDKFNIFIWEPQDI